MPTVLRMFQVWTVDRTGSLSLRSLQGQLAAKPVRNVSTSDLSSGHPEKIHLMPTSVSYFVWLRRSCGGETDFELFYSVTEVAFMLLSSGSDPHVNNFRIAMHACIHTLLGTTPV